MKKRVLSAVLSLTLVFVLSGQVFAAGTPTITLNGTALEMDITSVVENGTTYVSYWPIVKAMYPDANAVWEGGKAVVTAKGLNLSIQPGTFYIQANGRYLYVEDGFYQRNSLMLVPIRVLAKALGATVAWSGSGNTVNLVPGSGPIASGNRFYDADDLYWLSHIIHAESGNQPLVGKIAVGNVVLNRVADPTFPSTIRAVVLQPGQFTPVENGTIKLTPSAESLLAAKLCLDGANTAGDSLYFVNYHFSSWASRNRPYVATIGAHAFYA